nr:branched-chain amino acid ABC transporter permease [Planosporangium flavigriseum]
MVINGLSLGSIYALIALGFVVIFKATEVVNFAHGSMLMLGAYVIAATHGRIGFPAAVAAGLATAATVGLLIDRLLVSRLRRRSHTALAIVTIGVDIVLGAELARRVGTEVLNMGDPWLDHTWRVAGFTFPVSRLAAIAVALVLIVAFAALVRYTDWGVAMRAAAEDAEAASLMGIRLGRVSMVAWVVAGVLAAVAGLFLATFPSPGLSATASTTALRAFPAVVVGGMDSLSGAVVGGLVIGLAETLAAGYSEQLLFLGRGLGDVAPYAVMIAVLLWRPTGLFGTRELSRV